MGFPGRGLCLPVLGDGASRFGVFVFVLGVAWSVWAPLVSAGLGGVRLCLLFMNGMSPREQLFCNLRIHDTMLADSLSVARPVYLRLVCFHLIHHRKSSQAPVAILYDGSCLCARNLVSDCNGYISGNGLLLSVRSLGPAWGHLDFGSETGQFCAKGAGGGGMGGCRGRRGLNKTLLNLEGFSLSAPLLLVGRLLREEVVFHLHACKRAPPPVLWPLERSAIFTSELQGCPRAR